jgi:Fur family iron response transcriptional regulator
VDRAQLSEALSAHGVMPTAQRMAVAEIMLGEPKHLSAEQIIALIRARGEQVSKATVYNTLHLFCERGLLRTVDIDPVRQFYDSRIDPHHHFFNVDTGELTDIAPEDVELSVLAERPEGTVPAGVEVIVKVRGAAAPR